ncbi:MAG: hypothetical protein KGL99_12825, partial [Burkholderiales bacterium]|nr:hypothetical protein [Burkholderiales bacterium]
MQKQFEGVVGGALRDGSLSRRVTVGLVVLMWSAGLSSLSLAATGGGTGTTPVKTAYFEQGLLVRAGETVAALGPNLMGDGINEYNGSLEFNNTDVSLPGNSALPVMIGRRLTTASNQPGLVGGLFGDWDLDVPHLETAAGAEWYGFDPATSAYDQKRCSHMALPPTIQGFSGGSPAYVQSSSWWGGYHIVIPGSGTQTLLGRYSFVTPVISPTDGGTYPVLTKANWQLSCLDSLSNDTGEGFVAHAPDGTRYRFDHMARRAYPTYRAISDGVQVNAGRTEIWILPSQVTDRFGNSVTYTYDSTDAWKLLSITSSDGRTITLTYLPGTHRVQTVFDGTRTWTYAYNADGTLLSVTLPDASAWRFALQALEHATPLSSLDPGCGSGNFDLGILDPNVHTGTIVHPSGATGSFSHMLVWHGTSNAPGSYDGCGLTNKVPLYAVSYSLTAKTLSGPGMPTMTWTYNYSAPNGSFAPAAGNVVTKTVSIIDPQGNVTQNTYGTQYRLTEGLLLSSAEGVSGGNALRISNYTYAAPNAGPYPATVGLFNTWGDAMSAVLTPQSQRVITQQGVNFTQTVTGFDIYARPTGASKSSSLGYTKTEAATYYDDTNLWVLGQVATTATNGIQSSSTTYYASTALPSASYSFGKLQASYAFNADGTLSSVTDGLNHTTNFTNYVRGLAQRITYADGTYQSAVVNN